MPSILDGILPPQQEDQDSITRRLYPWLAPPPTASGAMPTPKIPEPAVPFAPSSTVPRGTAPNNANLATQPMSVPPPAPPPGTPGPQPVSLGPGAAPPAPAAGSIQPVSLGSSLDRPAPMPQPPPQAKPGLGAKLTAVALGASGGMPGIEKAIDYYHGVKDKPIADWKAANAREEASNKAALETRNTESEIDLRSAQADKDRTPPVQRPENPSQVYADAVQEAVNAGRDPRTDPKVLQIADTITSIQPEHAPKELSQQDRNTREYIDAHKDQFTPDASGNYYIASNMAKARPLAAAADQAPERGAYIPTYDLKTAALTGAWNPATGKTATPPAGGVTTASGLTASDKRTTEAKKELQGYQSVLDEADQAKTLKAQADGGNAEADVALIMTFFKVMRGSQPGQSSNIRFTQQESNLIQGARNLWGGMEVKGNRVFSNGQPLSTAQRTQVLDVIDIFASAAKRRVNEIQSGKEPAKANPAEAAAGTKPKTAEEYLKKFAPAVP